MGNSKSKKSQDQSSSLPKNGKYLPLSLGLLALVGVPLPADASALASISRLSARFEALSSSSRTRDNAFHSLANVDAATLATHNSAASCWLAITNAGATTVFDCTTYSNQHSGGPLTRFGVCGVQPAQATNAYVKGSGRHNANAIPNKCVTVGAFVATTVAPTNPPATNPPATNPPATTTKPATTTTTKPATTTTTKPAVTNPPATNPPDTMAPSTAAPTDGNANTGNGNGGTTTSYTMTDLSIHNAVTDCWMSINEMVYDCTSYLPNHPGPLNIMDPTCGTNATTIFATSSLAHDSTRITNFCTMKGALLAVAVDPNAAGGAGGAGAGAGAGGQTAAAPATQSWLQANPGLAIGVIVGATVIGLAILIQIGVYVYKMHYLPRKQTEAA